MIRSIFVTVPPMQPDLVYVKIVNSGYVRLFSHRNIQEAADMLFTAFIQSSRASREVDEFIGTVAGIVCTTGTVWKYDGTGSLAKLHSLANGERK